MKLCIVGTSRSGTTLLRSILHKNPSISFFNETHWIPKMYEFFGMQSVDWNDMFNVAMKTTWDTGKDLFTVNMQYSKYEDLSILLKDFKSELKSCNKVDIPLFSKVLTDVLFDNPTHWGDKTPDYGFYMGLIQQIWPSCKFIHVTRDGLAVAKSMSKHPGCQLMISAGYHNWCSLSYDHLYKKYKINPLQIKSFIDSWYIRMNRIRDESSRLKKHTYLEIQYENILKNVEETIRQIEDFTDLPIASTNNNGDYGINTNKRTPVNDLISELPFLSRNMLRELNQGFGECYFHNYMSYQELLEDYNNISKYQELSSSEIKEKCVNILASNIKGIDNEIFNHTTSILKLLNKYN